MRYHNQINRKLSRLVVYNLAKFGLVESLYHIAVVGAYSCHRNVHRK